jgi:hypothetical protein
LLINSSKSEFGHSKDWANGYLRQAIALLQEGAKSNNFWLWNQRLAVAIMMKTELQGYGFVWQAKRVENWIHRLQPRRADLIEREREETSF